MKTILRLGGLLACILCLPITAYSQGHPSDGLYIGLDGSYDKTTETSTLIPGAEGANLLVIPSPAIYDLNGIAAGIFVGYRQSSGRFTVAVEARYGYGFASNDAGNDSFKITGEYGASVLPGFWISDEIAIYGRLGFSQLSLSRTYQTIIHRNTDSGLHYGGGIQIFATDMISIRADYTRATYNHNMRLNVTIDPGQLTQRTVSIPFFSNLKRDRFQVSLISKF
ncbi:MAG: outer membrane beta-barrel protein [Emcibacteraceae bacterium]|nr:outer membrane beta-barrel protein [Emcibacteraceae bacterium]